MKKNKKLLLLFLALNVLSSVYASGATDPVIKYDRMYNKMVKNLEQGKSNRTSYKMIEEILSKKNKELKDLYLQSDYIVKPEYLEWQVFFTGFYTEKTKGDNTLENAEYYSKSETASGKSTVNGEVYKKLSEAGLSHEQISNIFNGEKNAFDTLTDTQREVYSGLLSTSGSVRLHNLPEKPETVRFPEVKKIVVQNKEKIVISKEPLNLSIPKPGEIIIEAPQLNINPVNGDIKFSIVEPSINVSDLNLPTSFLVTPPSTGNGDETFTALKTGDSGSSARGYTAMLSQYNLDSGEVTANYSGSGYVGTGSNSTGALTTYDVTNLNGTPDYKIGNGASYGRYDPLLNLTLTGGRPDDPLAAKGPYDTTTAFYKITAAEKITLGQEGDPDKLKMQIVSKNTAGLNVQMPHLIQYDPHSSGGAGGTRTNYKAYEFDHYGNATGLTGTSSGTVNHYGELINYGTLSGRGNSLLLVGLQSHNGNFSPTYKNSGLMLGLYDPVDFIGGGERHVAHAFIASASSTAHRRLEFYNTEKGRIELQAKQSIAFYYGAVNALGSKSHYNIINDGEIILYGSENIGIKTANASNELTYSKIILNKPIVINGDKSIGVEIAKLMDDGYDSAFIDNNTPESDGYDKQTAVIKVSIGLEENKYSGNVQAAGYSDSFVEESVGLYINKSGLEYRLRDFEFKFGEFAKRSTFINVANGHLFLDNSKVIGENDIKIDEGEDNFGIVVKGTGAKLSLRPNITVGDSLKNVNGTVALYAGDGGKIYLESENDITTHGSDSHAVVLKSSTSLLEDTAGYKHSFITTGSRSAALYSENATINLGNSSEINVKSLGNKAIAVYNKGGTVTLGSGTTGSGDYEIGKNGVLFLNNGTGGKIYTSGTNFTVGEGSLFAKVSSSQNSAGNEQIHFTKGSDISLNLLGGARGFVYDGTVSMTVEDYLNFNYRGLSKMNVSLSAGSTLLILENYGAINLSDIDTITAPGGIFKSISGNGDKAFLWKGMLTLNPTSNLINLDDSNDLFNRIGKSLTGLTLNNNVTMKSQADGQTALKGDNSEELTVYAKFINNGTIDLRGNSSTGIYASNGEITNNSIINVLGQGSIGLFSENGTITENNNLINIGDNSLGIYGISYQNPGSLPTYGAGEINIKNTGNIKAALGTKAIGIYAVNNKGTALSNGVDLSTGTIDVSLSKNGTGVYVDGVSLTGGGTIKVGEEGIGVYAKNSNINLLGLDIELNGDKSLAYYIEDNGTSFSASGTIKVNAQNTILFNIAGSSGTTLNLDGITINSSLGSSYIIGNLTDSQIKSDNEIELGNKGILLNGKNTNVQLGTNSVIRSSAGAAEVVGLALDNIYTGALYTPGYDGENKGKILLGDKSVGLYGVNGVRFLSDTNSEISVGNNSVGIYTVDSGSSALNKGNITIGENSVGIYTNNGNSIKIDSTGSILSTASQAVGIYGNGTVNTSIINDGIIDLSGDKSIGIYTLGTGIKNIDNTKTIKMGNSLNTNDPSVGIYSINSSDTINNNGLIDLGKNTIGIYSIGGTINQNLNMNIGESGTGIYVENGLVNLSTTSNIIIGNNNASGIYGINNATINSDGYIKVGAGSYGFVLESGSSLNGVLNVDLSDNTILGYSDTGVINIAGGTITMSGSDNIGFYGENNTSITNNANITGVIGTGNIGIYNINGSTTNYGNISVGDSVISADGKNDKYSLGIYGENSQITNHGNILVGENSIGIYGNNSNIVNIGDITSNKNGAIGILINNGHLINSGDITMYGDNSTGIYLQGSTLENSGDITIAGENSSGITLGINSSELINTGQITVPEISSSKYKEISMVDTDPKEIADIKSKIVNAGIINVNGNFDTSGLDIIIKVNPATFSLDLSVNDFNAYTSDAVKVNAKTLTGDGVFKVAPDFSQGTNFTTYLLKKVFSVETPTDFSTIEVKSQSVTFNAKMEASEDNDNTVNIWMTKIAYDNFTQGLWFNDFGLALDDKYEGSEGKAGEIFDKLDFLESEKELRHLMGSLAGNIYANINQREDDIARTLENTLDTMETSHNNTKENVKINVIAGKGKTKEDTDGVVGYDYTTTGVLALREVERTYRHKFGYSLGYLHTGFEFKDDNESEEWVDTIQLGVHSRYSINNWKIKNDLMGRVSFHNIDRNIDWPEPNKRSEMNGTYETYSLTSDNRLGREIALGKMSSITPYAGLRAIYVTRPTFSEKGLEALEVKGNDAWSVKPRAGVELQTALPLGTKTDWQMKGTLDLAYEYELSDLNEREKAKLVSVEDSYHKLSKPEDEKGSFKTKAAIGVEVEDKYGIFLTGEYITGSGDREDYRAGVTLKAVF